MFQSSQTGKAHYANEATIEPFSAFPVHLNGETGSTPVLSRHAAKRAGQRRISMEAINAALDYGTVTYRTGAVFSTLLRKDVKKARNSALLKHVGTTVLASSRENVIITVYRNPKSHASIKKLLKRGRSIN